MQQRPSTNKKPNPGKFFPIMDTFRCKNKVLAYITRSTDRGLEILVFTHRDYPEAGLQVPGGTLDEGEDPLTGVLKEVKEQTGLEKFSSSVLLGATEYVAAEKREIHLRSFFQLAYDEASESTFTHTVSAGEEDSGLVFLYRWVKLEDLPELTAEQGAMVGEIIRDSTPPAETQSPVKPPRR